MTRSQFIKKWLGNPERPFYTEQFRNEMLDDLDMVAQYQNKELLNDIADRFVMEGGVVHPIIEMYLKIKSI